MIVAAAGCVLLLVGLINHTEVIEVSSPLNQTGAHHPGDDSLVPAPPRSDRAASEAMDQPDVVPPIDDRPTLAGIQQTDPDDDFASYAAIAQLLSSEPGDDSRLPSEDVLRQLDDETIEHLVEINLAERQALFTRLIEFRPESDEGVVTGLRVIPRSPPGVELLLGVGLLQNDVIISINGKVFPLLTTPESLPGSFIVNLLTAPSSRLEVLRGGSKTLVIFEPGKLDSTGILTPR